MIVQLTIYGHLPSMKNSRVLVKNKKTGKPMVIKSPECQQYAEDFARQVLWMHKKNIEVPVEMYAKIYYRSEKSDLDDAFLCDLLQKNGVIKNDRLIRKKFLEAHVDPKNPRVVCAISAI